MKRLCALTAAALLWGAADGLAVEENVYTWTDSTGVTTLTNRRPRHRVHPEGLTRYQVPESRAEKPTPTKGRGDSIDTPQPDIDTAAKTARDTREAARIARDAADAFKKKIGRNKKRIRKNRSKITRLEEQAALVEQEARLAEAYADTLKKAAGELKSASP